MLQRSLDDADVSDATDERILEAALAAFQDFGMRRTTVEDVARRASVNRVTIYRRFSSKDALVNAVLMRELQRFMRELDAAVGRHDSADERLAEGFAFALQHLREHALLNRLLATEPDALLPHLTLEASPVLSAGRSFVSERLAQEVDEGRLPPLDVEVAAELLSRVVLSFILTPDTVAQIGTSEEARRFARRYLAPALHVTAASKAR